METLVERHLPRARVVVLDQSLSIIEQHLPGQPAEMAERTLDAVEPSQLPLVPERADIDPARVAQRGDEQVDPHRLLADPHSSLAEIDLQLPARRGLEPHRRQSLRLQLVRRLATMPNSAANSWRTTSALPRWRRNRSVSHASCPASIPGRRGA